MAAGAPSPEVVARLVALVDELLEAHCDTLCLADDPADGVTWAAHLDYLRALQRLGRRTLAELGDGSVGAPAAAPPSAAPRAPSY